MNNKQEPMTLVGVIKEAQNGNTQRIKDMINQYVRERANVLLIAEKRLSDLDARISMMQELLKGIEEDNGVGREKVDILDTDSNPIG